MTTTREQRIRRLAQDQGYALHKSRSPLDHERGGFMIADRDGNTVVAGSDPVPYFLTLGEAEAWLHDAGPIPVS